MNLGADSSLIDFAVSHNREDLGLAEALLIRLEAFGLIGWLDSRAFYSPLVSAERQIERAFRQARFICLLVGDRYRDSAWCREEYRLGLRSEADLSVTRVLVVTESNAATALVPEMLARAPRFNWTTEPEIKNCSDLIFDGRNTASKVAGWRETQGRSTLVLHLSTAERIKLIGDHIDFLLSHFDAGMIDCRNHQSAVRLGLTAELPTTQVAHLSPASAIEMCWRWTSEVVGKYSLLRFLEDDSESDDISDLPISDIRSLLVKILPLFRAYLATAASRGGDPPRVTEAELFAIVEYLVSGFLAVICKANQCEQELIDGARELLNFVGAHADKRHADVAKYLSQGLPAIGLPKFRTERSVHIYDLLHARP